MQNVLEDYLNGSGVNNYEMLQSLPTEIDDDGTCRRRCPGCKALFGFVDVDNPIPTDLTEPPDPLGTGMFGLHQTLHCDEEALDMVEDIMTWWPKNEGMDAVTLSLQEKRDSAK